jgi:hypothetical protein
MLMAAATSPRSSYSFSTTIAEKRSGDVARRYLRRLENRQNRFVQHETEKAQAESG